MATKQREVKDVASEQVVYITENGNSAFVFCSEDVFERELHQAREEARYETEMQLVLRLGIQEINNSEYTSDVQAFCDDALASWRSRGSR